MKDSKRIKNEGERETEIEPLAISLYAVQAIATDHPRSPAAVVGAA
jgi:hypothetical protein